MFNVKGYYFTVYYIILLTNPIKEPKYWIDSTIDQALSAYLRPDISYFSVLKISFIKHGHCSLFWGNLTYTTLQS